MSGLAAIGQMVGAGVTGLRQRKQDDRLEEDQSFQQEQRDRQRKTWQRQDKMQAEDDRADAAFSSYLEAQRQAWVQQTGQAPEAWRPDLNAQVGALDARGTELASAGRWKDLIQQRSQAAPIYTSARNAAIDRGLAQYQADGDPTKLAQTVYPHIRDGRKITFSKVEKGLDGKPAVRFNMDDGSSEVVSPDDLVATVKRLRMDPKLAAEMDIEHLKARMKAAELKTKHGYDVELEGVKQTGQRGLADLNNDAALRRTETSASATRYSADKGAESRERAAKIAADAKDEAKTGKVDWTGLASKHFGDAQIGALGGTKTASGRTLGLAVSAQEIYEANKDKPGMTPEKAVELAARAHGADMGKGTK